MKTYITSDLHFMHRNICKFTDRKDFTTQEQHDDWLINIWNSQVTKSDKVFHLGDFTFSHKYEEVANLLRRLNGQKFFIKGNHDRSEMLDSLKLSGLIQNWWDYKEIKIGDTTACLFHFPISSHNKLRHGSFMLHGHCHGSFQGRGKVMDVGLDSAFGLLGEHRLFSEEDVENFMKNRQIETVDNH